MGLDELTGELKVYPQRLVNVRVRDRKPLDELPGVTAEIRAAEASFGDAGRVLVRFSGTEPLARVMVEGPDLERVESFANRIASQIRAGVRGRIGGWIEKAKVGRRNRLPLILRTPVVAIFLMAAALAAQTPKPKAPGEDWVPLFNGQT